MLTALSAVAWRRGRHEAARLLSPLAVACGRIGIKPFASSASKYSRNVILRPILVSPIYVFLYLSEMHDRYMITEWFKQLIYKCH